MIQSHIDSVSVYRSGCIISRRATANLEAGFQSLKLLGPGPAADADSLRLSVPEGLEGSNVQLQYLSQEQKEEELAALSKKRERLGRSIADLEEQIGLWKTNADFSGRENISLQDMTAFLEQLPERLEALQARREELLEEQEALEKEWNEKEEQLSLPYVSVDLSVPAPGEYPLEIRYKDSAAAWAPVYEIHTREEGEEKLLLRLRARIAQDTGEDWSRVKLHLYSGNPAISGTIPTLHPQRVRFYEEPKMMARGLGMAPGAAAMERAPMVEEAMDYAVAENGAVPQYKMSQVVADMGQTIQGDSMTEYELKSLWDIRDGQSILCDLRSREIPCRYQVVAVPRISEESYLSARVKTADLEEMRQVEAAVYLKGTFAGNVFLTPDMTEEDYDLSLGTDETVKVKRSQKKKYSSQSLLKGQKKTEYEYEIAVSSRKPKACKVLLKDQIPVTEEKNIQVETQTLSGGELEEKTGLIQWQLDLLPGESRTLALAYSVAWPKDKEIIGG